MTGCSWVVLQQTHLAKELDDALVHDAVGQHLLVVQLADELDVAQHALAGLVLLGCRARLGHLDAPLGLGRGLLRLLHLDLQLTPFSLHRTAAVSTDHCDNMPDALQPLS